MQSRPSRPEASDHRFTARLRQTGPCTWLLLALVLLLIVVPLLDTSVTGRLLLGALNSMVLAAAVFAASQSRRALLVVAALALPAVVLQWVYGVWQQPIHGTVLALTMIAFYAFVIGHLVAFVLQSGPVTGNKLHGAIDAYIIMGLLWTIIYSLVEQLVPGSFAFASYDNPSAHHFPQLLFFSFTTLTTTGYGDTVPRSGLAQAAVILEQLAGTFYVAVLIARLAGLYQPGASRHR